MSEVKLEPVEKSDNEPKKQQKPRSFPMPKQINYYILQNYGYQFYSAKVHTEKSKILTEIMENLCLHGFSFSESEIERRLKNMKSHYRRKKEDLEMGTIKKTDWEYYDILHSLFTQIAKDNEKKVKIGQSSKSPVLPETNVAPLEPLINTKPNVTPPEAHQMKANTIKQEKVEQSAAFSEEYDEEPLDMSAKRMKILDFDNFDEIAKQIPIHSLPDNSISDKQAAINRVIENLKAVDQTRLALDEQRLKLEIRRNELDKFGYKLSEVLYKLTHS